MTMARLRRASSMSSKFVMKQHDPGLRALGLLSRYLSTVFAASVSERALLCRTAVACCALTPAHVCRRQ